MIQMGAANSPALFQLLAQGTADVDFITVYGSQSLELLERALAYRPVLLHDVSNTFWLNYADPFADVATVTKARTMLDRAQSPWFSTGIGASAEPQGHTSPYWRGADTAQLQTRAQVVDNIIRHGLRLRAWAGVPLLLENYNYHPTNAYEYVCEPALFSELVETIGCEVLLDLPHARISAYNMGWGADPRPYLAALPLAKVREIHFNRPHFDGKQMLDFHQPIQADDLDLLQWVIDRCPNLQVITLESEAPSEAALLAEIHLLRSVLAPAPAAV